MVGFRLGVHVCRSWALLSMLAPVVMVLGLSTVPAAAQDATGSTPQTNAADPQRDAQPAKPADAKADQQADAEQPDAKDAKADRSERQDKPERQGRAARQDRAQREAKPTGPASYPRLPGIGSVNSDPIPGTPWRVHDLFRPRPPVVTPGDVDSSKQLGTTAPSDAIVLFDGTDLSQWAHQDPQDPAVMYPPRWKIEDGYMEVTSGSGSLYTIDSFGSCQLHIEWATPGEPKGSSQGRGNSGIKFFGLYEVQVLDSYDNRTYADGQAGAIYGQFPPDVNASRGPGEWQSYDILFNAPQFDGDRLVRPAVVTVIHNGVVLHHARELKGVARGGKAPVYRSHPPAGQIMLQDHGNPTRFRNIWIRSLD